MVGGRADHHPLVGDTHGKSESATACRIGQDGYRHGGGRTGEVIHITGSCIRVTHEWSSDYYPRARDGHRPAEPVALRRSGIVERGDGNGGPSAGEVIHVYAARIGRSGVIPDRSDHDPRA